MTKLTIEKMLVIDQTGMPKVPDIRQLQDKDLLSLYARDLSSNKSKYLKEVGVIYYLGDPHSPAHQQGLSYKESLKLAIENYNLSSDYTPDPLVKLLIDKYYHSNIGEAGLAIEALNKSIHLISLAAIKINETLTNKLSGDIADSEISNTISLISSINKQIQEIPSLTMALKNAYTNLQEEEEIKVGRGGVTITSSMNADENE